jgi:hypothetical protein
MGSSEGKARGAVKEEDSEGSSLLTEHRLGRTGLVVKLDKGFEQGVYCVWIEYDGLADQVGFSAARRQALDYTARLRGQLARMARYDIEDIEDASQSGDGRRKRDLESTFLSFAVTTHDGRWRDADVTERFQVALLRANQEWDQAQARADGQRREDRRDRFRQRLDTLLAGDAYRHVDAATKERLLAEVTALAFPAPGRGL